MVPLNDQASVEVEAQKWGSLWGVGGKYTACLDGPFGPPPAQLLVVHLMIAIMSFPVHTGLGCDNVSPRAFARLPEEALLAFARLLMAIELVGSWPTLFRLVLIVLLPKADGGKRPIGLLPTPIRIWMRARASTARAWEALHARPCLFGGAGMGAQRAAWNVAYRAEHASLSKLSFGEGLLDIVKETRRIKWRTRRFLDSNIVDRELEKTFVEVIGDELTISDCL